MADSDVDPVPMTRASRAAIALGLCLSLTACSSDDEANGEQRAETVRAVKTEVVKTQPARRVRRFPAVLEAAQLVPLAFEVGGRIAAVSLRVGQAVSAGELLATIEPFELDLRLQQAEAALLEAEAAAANAREEANRQVTLSEKNLIAAVVKDRAVALAKQTEARSAQARSQVQILKKSRADAELRAPFDGVVNTVDVESFASVQAGQPVLTLYGEGELQAQILVSSEVAESLELGRAVTVAPAAGTTAPLPAEVTEIGRRAPAVSSFPVIVTLAQAPAVLRPGMAVEVHVEVDIAHAAGRIAIPLSAIVTDRSGPFEGAPPYPAKAFVFVPGEGGRGTLALRGIAIAAAAEDRVFVADGLAPGDIVVTGGVPFLRDRQTVRLMDGAATAPGEAAR